MLDFGLNIFFEQMDALQERVEELERLVSASLQERHAAEAALQRAETAYAGLQAENERILGIRPNSHSYDAKYNKIREIPEF